MRIQIHKGERRHTLRCFRPDGTSTQASTGPGLPAHDLAHYVAETTLGLRGGFFGLVAAGRSLAELSDPAVVPGLEGEVWLAEALARALGSLRTGACEPAQFGPLVRDDLAAHGRSLPPGLAAALSAEGARA